MKYTFEIEQHVTYVYQGELCIRSPQPGETVHEHSVYRRPTEPDTHGHKLAEWLADCGTAETAALLVAALEANQ